LVIDTDAGRVVAIIIPSRGGWWARRELEIPWHGIRKIGVDLIIVDMSTAVDPHRAHRWDQGTAERHRARWDPESSEPDLR
ncbi:MAG TPA: PRC-barrel domain-containing protein, partial [Limnochordales bacterium]|nr:PRC-barrel domain-containing protein [Limnochordales bacterium]